MLWTPTSAGRDGGRGSTAAGSSQCRHVNHRGCEHSGNQTALRGTNAPSVAPLTRRVWHSGSSGPSSGVCQKHRSQPDSPGLPQPPSHVTQDAQGCRRGGRGAEAPAPAGSRQGWHRPHHPAGPRTLRAPRGKEGDPGGGGRRGGAPLQRPDALSARQGPGRAGRRGGVARPAPVRCRRHNSGWPESLPGPSRSGLV